MITGLDVQACETGGELTALLLPLSLPEKVQLCQELKLGDFEPAKQTVGLCYSAMLDCWEALFKYWRESRTTETAECP